MRRWAAYERLAADPGASESERKQARERLDALRQRYPNGRPHQKQERNYRRWAEWEDEQDKSYRRWWQSWNGSYGEYDPDAERRSEKAKAEQARREREAAVRQQRAWVEAVPLWKTSATLCELHRSTSAWSHDEHAAFKAQRVRLTRSSRAVDL